jgi:hypothetical protein
MPGDKRPTTGGGDAATPAEVSSRLRRDVARLAGEIAVTEDHVAATRRQLAESDAARAAEHIAAAEEAERFAAHEREQQRYWQRP